MLVRFEGAFYSFTATPTMLNCSVFALQHNFNSRRFIGHYKRAMLHCVMGTVLADIALGQSMQGLCLARRLLSCTFCEVLMSEGSLGTEIAGWFGMVFAFDWGWHGFCRSRLARFLPSGCNSSISAIFHHMHFLQWV
jgi:hypothetical protein